MEYVTPDEKKQLLDTAIVRGDFVLASGMRSTEKFDFDRITDDSPFFEICVGGLVRCINDKCELDDFNTILTVATGANRLGDQVADRLRARHMPSRKHEGDFYLPERLDEGDTAIVLDDVYTTGSSMEKVKRIYPGRIVAAVAILDRSREQNPVLSDAVPVYSVIKQSF